jgi:hypothetical protein
MAITNCPDDRCQTTPIACKVGKIGAIPAVAPARIGIMEDNTARRPESFVAVGSRLIPSGPLMFREAAGLSIEDFMTLGFGLWAQLSGWRPGRPLIIDLGHADGIEDAKVDHFFQVIARDLNWFAAELIDQGPWDFVQFETTPVSRLADGRLALDRAMVLRNQNNGFSGSFQGRGRHTEEHERLLWACAYGAFVEKLERQSNSASLATSSPAGPPIERESAAPSPANELVISA